MKLVENVLAEEILTKSIPTALTILSIYLLKL